MGWWFCLRAAQPLRRADGDGHFLQGSYSQFLKHTESYEEQEKPRMPKFIVSHVSNP